MKKKTKKRLRLVFLWLAIGAAFGGLLSLPNRRPTPHQQWRVPVELAVPEIAPVPPLAAVPSVEPELSESIPESPSIQPETPPKERESAPLWPIAPPNRPISSGEGAKIAIIIDDMGLVPALSARAERLPPAVALSYLPYAPKVKRQAQGARAAGHEVLLHLPMQPLKGENPGPDALTVDLDAEAIKEKTIINFNKLEDFVGVNNHMGSRFTMDRKAMQSFIEVLQEKGVFFVDSRTSGQSVAAAVAQEAGVRTAARDVFLDDSNAPEAIRAELARLESLARRKGAALAIGHPRPATLEALESWLPDAAQRGFAIVPVEQLVR